MTSQILQYIGAGLASSGLAGVGVYLLKLVLIKSKVVVSSDDVSTQTDISKSVTKSSQTNHTGPVGNDNLTLSPTSTDTSSSSSTYVVSSSSDSVPTISDSLKVFADQLKSHLSSLPNLDLNGLLSWTEISSTSLVGNSTAMLVFAIPLFTGTFYGHLLSNGIVFGSNFLMKYVRNIDEIFRSSRYSDLCPYVFDSATSISGSQLTLLMSLIYSGDYSGISMLISLGYATSIPHLANLLMQNGGFLYLQYVSANPSTLIDDIIKCFNNDPIKLIANLQSDLNGKLNLHTNSMRIQFYGSNILNLSVGYATSQYGGLTLPLGLLSNHRLASSINNLNSNSSRLLESSGSSSNLLEFNTD